MTTMRGSGALNPTVHVQPTRMQRYHGRTARRRRARRRFMAELPFLVLVALVLTVLVKGFLVQAFYIPSRSMEPTLDVGDRVVVNRLAYRLGEPRHGQVVVFLRPSETEQRDGAGPLGFLRRALAEGLGAAPPGSEDLIKRVIGVPGDVVQGRGGKLWRNGRPVAEPYLPAQTFTSDFGPIRVKRGFYWVMGDNREDSADSRVFGQVPESALVGRAVMRIWPAGHLGGL
jgi:signal peptidase I